MYNVLHKKMVLKTHSFIKILCFKERKQEQ